MHLRRKGGVEVVSCDVYIGRAMYQGGWRLPASRWANPHRVGTAPGARERALALYEAHVRASPELMAALPSLRGKRLGCWCAPLPCHGDVLRRLLAEQDAARALSAPAAQSALLPDDDMLWAELGLA